MALLFKLLVLVALARLTVQYDPLQERPWLLALIYAVGAAVFDAAGFVVPSIGLLALLVTGAFLLSWLYFWLLAKLAEAGALWWLVLLFGLPIILL